MRRRHGMSWRALARRQLHDETVQCRLESDLAAKTARRPAIQYAREFDDAPDGALAARLPHSIRRLFAASLSGICPAMQYIDATMYLRAGQSSSPRTAPPGSTFDFARQPLICAMDDRHRR